MKILKFLLTTAMTISAGSVEAQHIQWASDVVDFSSQAPVRELSSVMVLGKPDVLPLGGRAGGSLFFATVNQDRTVEESAGPQFITVSYAHPLQIQQVGIGESYNPGAVTTVTLIDTSGGKHVIYSGAPRTDLDSVGRMFDIFFPMTNYIVQAVRVDLLPEAVSGWNLIDAIGISDLPDSIRAEIHLVPGVQIDKDSASHLPERLGTNINSGSDDFVDAVSPDGKRLYISRATYFPGSSSNGTGQNAKIYYSDLQPDGTWQEAQDIGKPLNDFGTNSVFGVSPDGNTLLVKGVYDSASGKSEDGVSISHRTSSGWSFPDEVRVKNYKNESNTASQALGPDGKTIILCYQGADTYGYTDIYVTFIQPDSTWSEPLNLGPDVNTYGYENSPYLAADGVSLYFSSDGRSGYGSQDIFVTRRLDSTWTHWSEPENLGPFVNSAGMDIFYKVSSVGDYAYFSRVVPNRGDLDVYRIAMPKAARPKPIILVSGKVLDSKTHRPIAAAIKYETLSGEHESGIARSDPSTGGYKIALRAGALFGFNAEANGYYPISQNVSTSDVSNYEEMHRDLVLVPIEVGQTVRLNNIFFDFAKSDLRPESAPELDRVAAFLKEHKEIGIEVSGHTDNVGNDAANLSLSQSRATAVAHYLLAKGIPDGRIHARGYGRSKPIASNDNEDGRQLNRRVEFTILTTSD